MTRIQVPQQNRTSFISIHICCFDCAYVMYYVYVCIYIYIYVVGYVHIYVYTHDPIGEICRGTTY